MGFENMFYCSGVRTIVDKEDKEDKKWLPIFVSLTCNIR
jgi:hypothetical protein